MRDPKVSVLLVVKNALPLLSGALNSLKYQTFSDFEIVVADGGSTDGTMDVLRSAAEDLPLRIVSESDRSLAEGTEKGLVHATGDILATLCADERYYPNTLETAVKWFKANPDAIMCGGEVDFIDEHDKVVGSHLTKPFDLLAHLACEVVPSILSSFFNRLLIGNDLRFVADAPTCPDYEFWGRLGFRFPPSAFKRYAISVAQAYRTRDSMSFRAESFTQFCCDKLAHLNNLLAQEYVKADPEEWRRRSSAGIHMWAAEQLNSIEPGHPDVLAHCAAAARYDNSYERIARFLKSVGNVRYDPAMGTIRRNVLGPRVATIGQFEWDTPPQHWSGATILSEQPLTVQTAKAPWGYSLQLSIPEAKAPRHLNGGQYWARLDLKVIEGKVGVSPLVSDQLEGERIFNKADGRATALIPLPGNAIPMLIRSGGEASSVMRLYHAELLYDPDHNSGTVAAIVLGR